MIEHKIQLTDDTPRRSKAYPTPHALRQMQKQDITKLMGTGVIRESESFYASLGDIVKKEQVKVSLCKLQKVKSCLNIQSS